MRISSHTSLIIAFWLPLAQSKINRKQVVNQFNPTRHASSNSTPMQVGNGNFAFGADITGLQTFLPYGILSSWGWHNFSLPPTPGQNSPDDFTGLDWWTHGRLVNYDQPNPSEPLISNWLIENPQRVNLGQIGFWFNGSNVAEGDLINKSQILDLYSGTMSSQFTFQGSQVNVRTNCDPNSDTLGVQVQSDLVVSGQLGIFFDYPYPDVNKFDDPFVGVFNNVSLHTTTLQQSSQEAKIIHEMDATTYFTTVHWDGSASMSGPLNSSHRYILQPESRSSTFDFTVNYSPTPVNNNFDTNTIEQFSSQWWSTYWESGGFVDMTSTSSPNATELQRRIILSQYLLAVNEAGHDSPQESGLCNNGWYGKFHMEMVLWHLLHWARWGKWSILGRTLPGLYERFLLSSIQRAQEQGYGGARWGKMSDPTGRSAPGEINSLLIWQQPHPFYFAELEYRAFPSQQTLEKWDEILTKSAEFMASFAWWNTSTGVYDLGPPMYPVSENTAPNSTINPTFELAHWRFGLNIATEWKKRQNLPVPSDWTHVSQNLAPFPIINGTYAVYEGIPDMWIDPTTYQDHPAMTGIYGLLPPTPGFNLTIMQNTAAKIAEIWDFPYSYGWDFPMLAMNSARLGNKEQAVGYLLHENFLFDDVGMPVGGTRVPIPYFPGGSSLLLAVAMLAGGWDGTPGPQFPSGWNVTVEGFSPAL